MTRLLDLPAFTRVHPPRPLPRVTDAPAVRLPEGGERLAQGVHRLPGAERTCPAWPTLPTVGARREAALTRYIRGASPLPGWYCRWPAPRFAPPRPEVIGPEDPRYDPELEDDGPYDHDRLDDLPGPDDEDER